MTTFIEFRQGTLEDVDAIVDLTKNLWGSSSFNDVAFKNDVATDLVIECVQHGVCSVLVIDNIVRGFVLAIIGPLAANDDVMLGTEVGFFVHPDYRNTGNGAGLVMHAEKTAKEKGASYFSMIFMHTSMPEEVARLYENLEYKKAETSYLKRL